MREAEIPVVLEPLGRTVYVLEKTKILEAAVRAGALLNTPCGGQGTCGKCRVRVVKNACPPNEAERAAFSAEELAEGMRLACQSRICGPTTIEIPRASVIGAAYQILGAESETTADEINPAVRKQFLTLTPPSREHAAPDLERLEEVLGNFKSDLSLLAELPRRLRAWSFSGTAVLADHRLIDFEEGDTRTQCFSVAFDIGTTTLVGVLLDLNDGRERATTSRLNPQTTFGDDVLSRILHAREQPDGLKDLHDAIVAEVNGMIDELIEQAGVAREHVYEATFAGNTTMQQLLLGLDPAALGEVPFVPVARRGVLVEANELELNIHPRGRAYAFPVIGGFVGGDTVAGLVATEAADTDAPAMLVDIGTNGEIVLCHDGQILAASTAAGPAFEGARIHHGMRAAAGAIEKVLLDGDVRLNVIGDMPPIGICGSALIDVVAELLRIGVVIREGLLLGDDLMPEHIPEAIRRRVRQEGNGTVFVLAERHESGTEESIVLTQRDIRELQLATGAIRAGISILLQRAGLKVSDLERVYIAGGFGNFIRRSNAQRIGLLPSDLPHEKMAFVGNASLAGAWAAAVSQKARAHAEEIARHAQHVDLSLDPAFQMEFAEAMFFPETVAPT